MLELNTNNNNNKRLEYEWNKEQIHYLDVSVFRQEDELNKVYFKPMDRNSYHLLHSGQHPHWLKKHPQGANHAS